MDMNGIPENQKLEFALNVKVPGGIEKKCTKCKVVKSLNEFCRDKTKRDGFQCACKECYKKKRIIGAERIKETKRQWCRMNSEKVKKANRQSYKRNIKKRLEARRQWRKANPEKYREIYLKTSKKQRSTIEGKLNNRIGSAIAKALRNNKNFYHWETLVGYTIDQLKKHLEKKFTKDMTWELFSQGKIHIDHIIPKSKFNYEKPEDLDFKCCWGLKNLQPLWAKDNISKHAKINKFFQPSLIF